MKKGDLVKWKKSARLPEPQSFSAADDVGIIINVAWTGNWVWILWGMIGTPQLCNKDALVAV